MITIKDALRECIADAKLSRATSTCRAYENGLNVFKLFLAYQMIGEEEPATSLLAEIFQKYPLFLLERDYSKKTINVYLSAIKCLIEWLVIHDLYNPSVAEEMRLQLTFKVAHKKRELPLPRFPKEGQAEAILKMADIQTEESPRHERNKAIVLFLYSTGCRNNEITQMKIKDIDLANRTAIVTGKGKKQRVVYFSTETRIALALYFGLRNTTPEQPVFIRHDKGTGKKIQKITTVTVRNLLMELSAAAGIEKGKFTPHYFRHAFAINMLRQTGNLALVQDLLGHTSPTATRVYAKIYPEDLRKAGS